MMKLFRGDQIKQIDAHTISEEPVSSVDLMERAALQLLKWFLVKFDRSERIFIFAGPGNNGGDGLALARLLSVNGYETVVWYIDFTETTSDDWKINLKRLGNETNVRVNYLKNAEQFPVISEKDIIVDAIFGTGLTRIVSGLVSDIIKLINNSKARLVSIDIPSGLFGEDNSDNDLNNIISADYTLTFQFPKLSFMFPENSRFTGEWTSLPIGLSSNAIRNTDSPYSLLEGSYVASLLKKRNKFDHKGTFGHGLLISGSLGKAGAAVLGSKAALRAGIGLLTCHIPSCAVNVLQGAIPEAMAEPDRNEDHLTAIGDTGSFSAVGIGPGIGTDPETHEAFYKLLGECKKPMVIDADALNILSMHNDWYSLLAEGTILTPHPKEFERLAGKTANSYERLNRQMEFSRTYRCIVILKGAHTSITIPDCKVVFNSTGNPGMATGGSGDVLTGILLSLLSQGYPPENAAVAGVYIHGLAGDIAAEELCYESIIASDIINCLSDAFKRLRESYLLNESVNY
jgi:ADP-dependent NAD(P)H-hydrate dehydratase / NAD(P)H-hydrate epimerase